MARDLFGTDGVRGVAGVELTAELALSLARAAVTRASAGRQDDDRRPPRVLVVRDTRESGEMLEAAVAAGAAAAGAQVLLGGVLPTPGCSLLLRRYELDLGVVISASHNPFADNGVKFFGAGGDKLSDTAEEEIEKLLARAPVPSCQIGRIQPLHGALEDYLRELHTRFEVLDLTGRRILLDCANGATYRAAPEIFRRLGADVETIADSPDGRNINADCGSTHLGTICARIAGGGFDAGFAFDGDGDRVLAVDRNGAVVDGDELIALAALHLRAQGRLRGEGVAVTVMTNYGFHAAMREAGIAVEITDVGDRYVLEALRARDWALGGEQSGHIIELGFNTTGDGIASALLALEALDGGDLAARGAMRKLPQKLLNVRVRDRATAGRAPGLAEAIDAEQEALEGRGRVLVRPSGTEALVRVMVEAPSAEEANAVSARLASLIERAAGA